MEWDGQPVSSWGGGHAPGPSASPQSNNRVRVSTSSPWGHRPWSVTCTGGKCESSMDFDLGNRSSANEWPVLSIPMGGGLVTHRPGITPPDVDSMWIPMYE